MEPRHHAVLVLLYTEQLRWFVPLTLHPDHMIDHAGQVSLPGGTHECGETAEHCAVRQMKRSWAHREAS